MFRARDKQKKWTTAWNLFVCRKNRGFLRILEEFIDRHMFDRECPMEVWISIQRTISNDTDVLKKEGWFVSYWEYKHSTIYFQRDIDGFLEDLVDYNEGEPFVIVRRTKIGPEEVWFITLVKQYREKDILAMGYRRNEEGEFESEDAVEDIDTDDDTVVGDFVPSIVVDGTEFYPEHGPTTEEDECTLDAALSSCDNDSEEY